MCTPKIIDMAPLRVIKRTAYYRLAQLSKTFHVTCVLACKRTRLWLNTNIATLAFHSLSCADPFLHYVYSLDLGKRSWDTHSPSLLLTKPMSNVKTPSSRVQIACLLLPRGRVASNVDLNLTPGSNKTENLRVRILVPCWQHKSSFLRTHSNIFWSTSVTYIFMARVSVCNMRSAVLFAWGR